MFDTVNTHRFKTQITYNSAELTGMLICKKTQTGIIVGSFINEFGIKVFDVTISSKKAKLTNVFNNINKWYIRPILASDLHFILFAPRDLKDCTLNDTIVSIAKINCTKTYVYKLNTKTLSFEEELLKRGKKAAIKTQTILGNGIHILMKHTDGKLSYDLEEIKQ